VALQAGPIFPPIIKEQRCDRKIIATAFATLVSTSTFAADLPGKGITVSRSRAPFRKRAFQTLLVSRALEKLGYTVDKPSEVDYNVGYTSIASGDAPLPP
jgi:glycine betaine/proline transport system substrate-binding protein